MVRMVSKAYNQEESNVTNSHFNHSTMLLVNFTKDFPQKLIGMPAKLNSAALLQSFFFRIRYVLSYRRTRPYALQ